MKSRFCGKGTRQMTEKKKTRKKARRTKRSLVLLTAKVVTNNGVVEVRLRNLSQNGALLEADEPPPEGTEVLFERGETRVAGRVAWIADERFGVEFFEPIEESEVLIHVRRPQPVPLDPAMFRRPAFRQSRLTPGERKLAEAWATMPGSRLGE
jgi:hypothetical protein